MSSNAGGTASKSSDGVPRWNGEPGTFQDFEEQCLMYEQSVEYHKRYLVGPRVIAELQGTARKVLTGRPANSFSHPGGLQSLLKILRESLGKPQVSEVADYLNKYFKGSRRRTGETMGDYIIRKTEAYLRAQQALQRVHPAPPDRSSWWRYLEATPTSSRRSSWDTTGEVGGGTTATEAPPGEEETPDEATTTAPETARWTSWSSNEWQGGGRGWSGWSSGWNSSWQWSPWQWAAENASTLGGTGDQLTEILPDFVQGWFLLNDAGLQPSERNLIHTAVQGEYSVKRIAQELRNQWDEQSLRRRESSSRTQSGFLGDEADEVEEMDEPNEMGCALEDLNAEGLALVAAAEDQVTEAMAAIEKGKRTLREARARQHEVRLSRQYFKTGSGPKGTTSSSTSYRTSVGNPPDDSKMTCLKCGKLGHRAANCPNKPQQAQMAEGEAAESAPFICYTEMALATEVPETKLSTMEAIKQGYCVIDGGATRTLGSMAALQAVLDKNQAVHGDPRLLQVDTERRPRFSFGNSTEGKCTSTVELGIKAGPQDGRLTVHALDEGVSPILLSVSTLRSLGALIDFEHDLVTFRKLSDRHVIPLKQSQNGHQLLQLTQDLYEHAETATSAIPSLKQFLP